jgi:diguanylate cyclase
MRYSIRGLSSKQLPDAVFVELVDLIFRPILPAAVIGVATLCVGTLIALGKGDIAVFALTIGCVLISAARISLIMAYRRRTAGSPLNAAEARVWERCYAVASFTLAALIGSLNARGLGSADRR